MATQKKSKYTITPLDMGSLVVHIVGAPNSGYIGTKLTERAFTELLDKQTGKNKESKKTRKPKEPEKIYLETLHQYPGGGYGIPSSAFRSAMIDAGRSIELSMSEIKQSVIIPGQTIKIISNKKPEMRIDPVKNATGVIDLRVRGWFENWECFLPVYWDTNIIPSEETILKLLQTAGEFVGVGDWRPRAKKGHGGPYGRFEVR